METVREEKEGEREEKEGVREEEGKLDRPAGIGLHQCMREGCSFSGHGGYCALISQSIRRYAINYAVIF